MTDIYYLCAAAALGGLFLGGVLTAWHASRRHAQLATELARTAAKLEAEQRLASERNVWLEEARRRLGESFQSLSAVALKHSNESFLRLAEQQFQRFQQGAKLDLDRRQTAIGELVRPLDEKLKLVDGKLGELEKARIGAYAALDQQLKALLEQHLPQLHRETAELVKALRQPQARGRWGELQLRRVVEMAGMLEHCDFDEQVSQTTDEGRLRPDLIVRLPGGRNIVVDAKAPVEAYLDAVEAQDEDARRVCLERHAQQVRTHIMQLSRKAYFEQFDPSPEFVVMFVPGEAFFSAAVSQSPQLIEFGSDNHVIPASPTTLIALLKAVAYGWRQEAMARNAMEVAALGKDLYERIGKLADHWRNVGDRLNKAVVAYNESVGTLESRVLPAARKFRDLKTVGDGAELDALEPLTTETRLLTAAEFASANGQTDRSRQRD